MFYKGKIKKYNIDYEIEWSDEESYMLTNIPLMQIVGDLIFECK